MNTGMTCRSIIVCATAMFIKTMNFIAIFRHVIVPQEIAKNVPKTHLMSETEWRNLGVQQSVGWVN